MAKKKSGPKCAATGKTARGRLKKGFRWAKGRKGCAISAKTAKKTRRRKARR